MSYFVTGTDTGVGKTLISCALLHAFAARGKSVAGFKPVAAGCDADGCNDDAKALFAASSLALDLGRMNPYCLREAIAPHIAARNAGEHIDFAYILESFRKLAVQAEVVVVEGAGGFKVPLNETQDSAELARQLGLPVVLVVGMRLGCLNHALLTADAIAAQGLKLAGWVANVLDMDMPALHENIAALEQRLDAPLLGVVEYQAHPDAGMTAAMLNIGLLENDEKHGG